MALWERKGKDGVERVLAIDDGHEDRRMRDSKQWHEAGETNQPTVHQPPDSGTSTKTADTAGS